MQTRITTNTDSFYTVLITKVRLYVEKQKRVRDPISVEEKLAITLLFLATGESYKSLKHQFRISDSYGCSFVTNQASKTQNFMEINLFYVFVFLCPPEIFLCFHGVQKGNFGLKWVNFSVRFFPQINFERMSVWGLGGQGQLLFFIICSGCHKCMSPCG